MSDSPNTSLQVYLESNVAEIAKALPEHLKPARMVRLAVTAFERDPKLRKCTQESILGSLLQASQMGLEIGIGGQGFLVPTWNNRSRVTLCNFVPGWKGLVDIVNRAGKATVWTGAVFEGDEFDYALGDSPFVKHKPMGEDDPLRITHVYAIGRIVGSPWPVVEVWPIARVNRHFEKYNKVGENHYAYSNWEMYARKVPLLQVLKYMPSSVELSTALQAAYVADGIPDAGSDGDGDIIDGSTGEVIGKATVKQQPQRKSQAAAASTAQQEPTDATQGQPKQAAQDASPLASEGAKAWVRNNISRAGITVEAACERVGIRSLDGLTEVKFKALSDIIRGKA